MKTYRFITILLIFIVPFLNISAQTLELQRLRSDYPKSTHRFPLDKQSATYVFAIDFSNSMKNLEPIVKRNLELFINSLPDGDRITLIREGATENTDFIYLPNAIISSQSRQAIIKNLNATPFNQRGSDGFKLAEKVIEAIDQTGGNELIYIFIFTDFEYYTIANGYNKRGCDWNKLKSKYSGIQKGKRIIKTGLEFQAIGLNPEAIFKTDLDTVFQGVKYYNIVDGSSLANWFADTRANILRDRLKFVVEKKIQQEVAVSEFHLKPQNHAAPECWIKNKDNELLKSFTFSGPDKLLKYKRPLIEWPFASNSLEEGEIFLSFDDTYLHAKGYNEIEKLAQDSLKKSVKIYIHMPKAYISWPVALIILLILLAILTCIFITCLAKKVFDSLRINADWTVNGKYEMKSQTFNLTNRVTIGSANSNKGISSFHLPDINKQAEIYLQNSCPCRLWIKHGVYIKANQGNNIKFTLIGKKEVRSLMAGSLEYLSPLKDFLGVTIEFEENSIKYSLKVRK